VFIVFSKAPVAAASSASVTYPLSNDEENERSCDIEAVAEVLNEVCEEVNVFRLLTEVFREAVVASILVSLPSVEEVYELKEAVVTNEPVSVVVLTVNVVASPFVNVIVSPAADAVTNREPVSIGGSSALIRELKEAESAVTEAVYSPNGISSTNESIMSELNVRKREGEINPVLLFGNCVLFSTISCCLVLAIVSYQLRCWWVDFISFIISIRERTFFGEWRLYYSNTLLH
jgi:hypothetical protein